MISIMFCNAKLYLGPGGEIAMIGTIQTASAMFTTNIVVYDHVPIIRRRLEEALRRKGDADPHAFRTGILFYNGLKSALTVPVLRKRFSNDTPVDVGDSFWDVESWIAPPATSDVPLVLWTKSNN
ncbi:hypothetical protein F5887DRAFT_1284356 [Amanita rubescens]|nr:hypothetical protein F5887DRAFT_1284356 [Amanita rubescens]